MKKRTKIIILVLFLIFVGWLYAPTNTQAANHSTLHFGDKGYEVTQVQYLLASFGYVLPVDGIYGAKTYKALVHFQDASGLVADGVVGSQTWKVLDTYIPQPDPKPAVKPPPPGPKVTGNGPDAARAALKAAGVDPATIDWAVGICMRESHCQLIHVYRASTHDDSWGPWMINYWGLDARNLTIGPKESNITSWSSAVTNFLKLYHATGKCPWQSPNYCG